MSLRQLVIRILWVNIFLYAIIVAAVLYYGVP